MQSSRPGYLPYGQRKGGGGCARHDPPINLLYKCACLPTPLIPRIPSEEFFPEEEEEVENDVEIRYSNPIQEAALKRMTSIVNKTYIPELEKENCKLKTEVLELENEKRILLVDINALNAENEELAEGISEKELLLSESIMREEKLEDENKVLKRKLDEFMEKLQEESSTPPYLLEDDKKYLEGQVKRLEEIVALNSKSFDRYRQQELDDHEEIQQLKKKIKLLENKI